MNSANRIETDRIATLLVPGTRQIRKKSALRNQGASWISAAALAISIAIAPAPAAADQYDEEMAGHPLRIVAYAIHPVGAAFEFLIMRPAHWFITREPVKTMVGHQD